MFFEFIVNGLEELTDLKNNKTFLNNRNHKLHN